MKANKNEMDMIHGNLFKKMAFYAFPLIASGILQLFYNAADLIVCNTLGSTDHSTAAISGTNSLINLIVQLFMGVSIGANVAMGRCYGANDKEKGERVIYSSIIFSIIGGLFVGIFGFFCSGMFLTWMDTPSDVIELSKLYLKIYFLGLPFNMLYNFEAALLRCVGDTRRPFIILSISGLINVLLNIVFVSVFHLDVAGVALATIIAQAISAIATFIVIYKNKGFIEFDFKKLKLYKEELIEIIKIGLPAGIQSTIISMSNVLIQSSVNSLGTLVMDGNGASSSMEGFIYVSMMGVDQACCAFVATNYGAKNKANIKKSVVSAFGLILIVCAIVGGIELLFVDDLFKFYVTDQASVVYGKERYIIIATTYFLCGFMDVLAYALRGIGYSFVPMLVSTITITGFRFFYIYTLFPLEYFHNLKGIALSYTASWIINAFVLGILLIILYKKKVNFTDK